MRSSDWYDALWVFVMLAAFAYFGIQLSNYLQRCIAPLLMMNGGIGA